MRIYQWRKRVIEIKGNRIFSMLLISVILTLAAISLAAADAPYFDPPINDIVFNMSQGDNFYFDVNASDPENDSLRFEYISYMNNSLKNYWNTFRINNLTGEINFTPDNDDVTYPYGHGSLRSVLVLVIDSTSNSEIAWLYFNITNINDLPNITFYEPEETIFSMYENDSRNFTFNYDATDPDIPYGDYLNATWFITGYIDDIYYDAEPYTFNKSWRYTPGFCDAGTKNITLRVNDSFANLSVVEWEVTVLDVNREPTFSGVIENITMEEDTELINNISLDMFFSDPDDECGSNIIVYTVNGNNNSNVFINISNSTDHNVSFIPARNWHGFEIINFTRFDGYNYTTSNNIVLNVTNMPDEPVIENISNQTAHAFAPFWFQVNASSPDCIDCLTYYDNTSLFDIVSDTGLIYFTPDDTTIGNFSIMINVTEGGYNVFTTFNLEIINNSRPYIYPIEDQFGQQGTPKTIVVDGFDPEGDNLVFSTNYSNLGNPTQINETAASFSFTPNQFDADIGNISIMVWANDSYGASYSRAFNLSILDINNVPEFIEEPAYFIIKLNHTYSIQLNASDDDFDTLLFTHNSTVLDFPNFDMDTSGLITIAPNETDLGNHTVRINVSDSPTADFPLSTVIDVLFIVTPNRAPSIMPLGQQNATENQNFVLQVNATDPDEDALEFFTNISLNFSSSGLFNFTPNQSMVGLHNITVNVTDNDGGWDTITFLLYIEQTNDAPYFEPPLENYTEWSNVFEGSLTEIFVNATDEEDDDLIFNSTFLLGETVFEIAKIGRDRALINFTPNQSMIGNYSVNISVSDGFLSTSVVINFTINDRNDPPMILEIYPYGTPLSPITILEWRDKSDFPDNITIINASESHSLLFNHTSYDDMTENLTSRWLLDGNLVSTESYWTYEIDYSSEGWHNITLIINDSEYYDNMTWQINITNVNRPPAFGLKSYSEEVDFSEGEFYQTNSTSLGIMLENFSGVYYTSGTYTSEVIDMGIRFAFGRIEWDANIPEGTNISIATSTSNSPLSGWSNWSYVADAAMVNSSIINSSTARYLKFMIGLDTNNSLYSPEVSSLAINYVIDNLTQIEKYYTIENSSDQWLDLDDFFSDPDGDLLNYSYEGSGDEGIVTIWIESWNENRVGIRSNSDGIYYVTFTASDPEGNAVSSNLVRLTFTNDPTQDSDSGTGTSSITRTVLHEVPKEVDKYVNLDIIVPEAMTTYQNSTIVSPINIVNTGDKTLTGIDLSAATNITGVELEFTTTHIDSLGAGESQKTNLIITSPDFLGSYEITVTADVKDPMFSDTAKIVMTTLEKGSLNQTQLNTKITFTRDLLLSNPECLELNELLTEASAEVEAGNYVRANELIEETIRYCRYLVTSKESVKEAPSLFETIYMRIFNLTSKRQLLIFGSVVVGVFMVLTLSLVIEKIKVKKDIKKRKESRLVKNKEQK